MPLLFYLRGVLLMGYTVNLSNLPRNKNGTICWKKSVGSKIYVCDNKYEMEIIDY